jgi:hypothetical protein
MGAAELLRLAEVAGRATSRVRLARPTRRRATESEIRIIPVTRADVRAPVHVNHDEEWDTLGAEAMCMLHLTPAEIAAAVDQDLSTSRAWLLGALGRAMDEQST